MCAAVGWVGGQRAERRTHPQDMTGLSRPDRLRGPAGLLRLQSSEEACSPLPRGGRGGLGEGWDGDRVGRGPVLSSSQSQSGRQLPIFLGLSWLLDGEAPLGLPILIATVGDSQVLRPRHLPAGPA